MDLDFNLTQMETEESVFLKVKSIIKKYGEIHDEARKHYGPIVVLSYERGERKLKVEISNRNFGDRYEIRDYLGISIRVMVAADMFAHKLCALLDRNTLAGRDVFDSWFFLKNHYPVNKVLIEKRMNQPFSDYIGKCIARLEKTDDRVIMHGTGELIDKGLIQFTRSQLRKETIELLRFYEKFPISDDLQT